MPLAIAFEYSVCSSRRFILWMNYSEDTVVLFDNYGPLSHVSRPHVLVSVLCRQPLQTRNNNYFTARQSFVIHTAHTCSCCFQLPTTHQSYDLLGVHYNYNVPGIVYISDFMAVSTKPMNCLN